MNEKEKLIQELLQDQSYKKWEAFLNKADKVYRSSDNIIIEQSGNKTILNQGKKIYEQFNCGCYYWYHKLKTHREDGPARYSCLNGEEYWLENNRYSNKEDWQKAVTKINRDKIIAELQTDPIWKDFKDPIQGNIDWNQCSEIIKDGSTVCITKECSFYKKPITIHYKNGVRHREGGPAVIGSNGQFYWFEGKEHRTDGPSEEYSSGYKRWHLYGRSVSEEQFNLISFLKNDLIWKDIASWDYCSDIVYNKENSTVQFKLNKNLYNYKNGKLHCESGPARILDGCIGEYWLDGKRYSKNTMASNDSYDLELLKRNPMWKDSIIIWDKIIDFKLENNKLWIKYNNDVAWFMENGKLHKEDGSAIVSSDVKENYYLEGIYYSKQNYDLELIKRKEKSEQEQLIQSLKNDPIWKNLDDPITGIIDWDNLTTGCSTKIIKIERFPNNILKLYTSQSNWGDSIVWYQNGKRHKTDGPAFEYLNGDGKSWWKNGLRHREDGPAHIKPDGTQDWYLEGRKLSLQEIEQQKFLIDLKKRGFDKYSWWNKIDKIEINGDNFWVQGKDGDQCWYKNYELHHDDGPAVINSSGQFYWKDGKKHREDGPACVWVENIHGNQDYWLDGKGFSSKEELEQYKNDFLKEDKLLEIQSESEIKQSVKIIAASQTKKIFSHASKSILKDSHLDQLLNSKIGTDLVHYCLATYGSQKLPQLVPLLKEIRTESLSGLQNTLISAITSGLSEVSQITEIEEINLLQSHEL